ncbi:tetratricopeptide (TPR) repeat protein [Lewinella aquimaris]|uniref:Tetratricopeptide (TPR) repeat protein n=1 Tax=Neolewinella aquimaris TaxID=1835722 RepID=A0A840E407_9BACT|nr:tetratricopeptide repeat protein [Neolewinella aquimaris]MBB4079810.1 tetratricopeptide (TPR) repeat protein [Neolewinella aquimaris]
MLRYLSVLPLLAALLLLTGCGEDGPDAVTAPPSGDPGINRLSAMILQQPEAADLYAQRSLMFYDVEDYDNAIADLTTALSIDSTNLDYHYRLADVYLDYYRSRLALRTLENAARLDPDQLETQLRLAETQLILKQYDDAIASLNQAVRLDPRNPEAYYLLSQVFAETGDTLRATNAAEEATQINPDMTDAYLLLGELAAAKGDPRAIEYFNAAVDIDPGDVIAIHARADYYRDTGDLERAIAEYRRASITDRQYVAGNFNAGLLLMELDSVRRAYDEFNITIKNDPIHIRAYFYRGYASELMGDVAAARSDYETALRMSPDFTLALEGLARLNG